MDTNILCCPKCKTSSLSIYEEKVECKKCHSSYPMIFGIPMFMNEIDKESMMKLLYSDKRLFRSKILGIESFKLEYMIKKILYQTLRIRLPKLRTQHPYWMLRGKDYMKDFFLSGYSELEIFFQDLIIAYLKELKWSSLFEAGCGFGWNLKRAKQEFPENDIGGLDFSLLQLYNGRYSYFKDIPEIAVVGGDITEMPYIDNAFDIGFSLGVFMNIHKAKINKAIDEMIRVSKKYIIHFEYDENYADRELKEKRAFKTNIVSHNYYEIYKERGLKIKDFKTYKEIDPLYMKFIKKNKCDLKRWEKWEGVSKYTVIVVEK